MELPSIWLKESQPTLNHHQTKLATLKAQLTPLLQVLPEQEVLTWLLEA